MNRRSARTINLALQGGGAHGAFTWGVLDRLLEEPALSLEGVSATSAGAMNAAALKSGLVSGGSREAARAALDGFWGSVARISRGAPNPLLEWVRAIDPSTGSLADALEASPGWQLNDALSRMFSPYELNPFNINPLRDLLESSLDFDAVCRRCAPHLFISATNVRTGRIKVFKEHEVSTDAILASACLPTLFQAVEIDDPETGRREAYWDGGFVGNPALFPLFHGVEARDVVIVHINPIRRDALPRSAREILNRVNEVSFNAALLGELRAINFARRLIAEGKMERGRMKDILIHSIADDATMLKLGVATKVQADWTLLKNLRDAGRAAADAFLRDNWGNLGERASLDLRAVLG